MPVFASLNPVETEIRSQQAVIQVHLDQTSCILVLVLVTLEIVPLMLSLSGG